MKVYKLLGLDASPENRKFLPMRYQMLYTEQSEVKQMLIQGAGLSSSGFHVQGKVNSKGYRSILLFCKNDKSFFVYGFAKNVITNISEDEEEQFKKMAKYVLALTDSQLSALIAHGQFEEVVKDD